MPTPTTNMRIGAELIDAARRALKLPADAPVAQVVRAALLRLTSDPHATGEAEDKGGRPPKAEART
jgi:hypothetical protein